MFWCKSCARMPILVTEKCIISTVAWLTSIESFYFLRYSLPSCSLRSPIVNASITPVRHPVRQFIRHPLGQSLRHYRVKHEGSLLTREQQFIQKVAILLIFLICVTALTLFWFFGSLRQSATANILNSE